MGVSLEPVSPDKLPPNIRIAAEKARMAAEAAKTPEQRYEGMVNKLPGAVKWAAPGTMGEAGFVGGGAAMGTLAALGLAPETGGLSLAVPLAGAAIGGALEDPAHRVANAAYETGKGALMDVGGKVLGKGAELAGRTFKGTMLDATAKRISQGVKDLFYSYPLPSPKTAEDLENHITGGKLVDAAGAQLGKFRDKLKAAIPEYKPGAPSKLVDASSGVMPHYTPAVPSSGQVFNLPDVNAQGERIMRKFNISDAIDHVRRLQASAYTSGGTAKSAELSWLERETGHHARDALAEQLNQIQPGLGWKYRALSGDYGAAVGLQKSFKGVYRSDRQLDQAKLLTQLRNELPNIGRAKGLAKAQALREAVSPTGAKAIPETPLLSRVSAGGLEPRAHFHIPTPYKPETRTAIPQPFRLMSEPTLRAVLGFLAKQAGGAAIGGGS